ncbi:hypothetical protein FH968_19805 [Buttiauxella sp. B2]|uniref:prepilin peptidase n=1 Tax=Buttiauxella sp. B2 TaxID=2587812 RepID=UPI001121FDA7|nr:prepilin peptidase [Buttiauxella sp. B2]TNV16089.1 hypothetical protein FH968_19805 [Buttiauxella sp. B2]
MTPIIITIVVSIMGAIYVILPLLYSNARNSVIEQITALESNEILQPQPLACLVWMVLVIAFWLSGTHSLVLCGFVLILAVAAYIDKVCEWVPDWVIYGALWYSVAFHHTNVNQSLISSGLILVFPLLLNFVEWLRNKKYLIASGDIYLLPSIGWWVQPEYAFALCGVAYLLACVVGKVFKTVTVPFIPFLSLIFIAYKTFEGVMPYAFS